MARSVSPRQIAEVHGVRRSVGVELDRLVRPTNKNALVLIAAIAVAVSVALGMTIRGVIAVGNTQTEGRAIPLQGATSARVELELDAGELRLGRGSSRLLDAAFTYNVTAWEPDISYHVVSREGVLTVEQGDVDGPFPLIYGNTVNVWDLLLSPNVPVDLDVDLGSADGMLAVGGLDLLGLTVTGDGGDTTLDLSGPVARTLDVHVSTGGGDFTLTVPTDAGVRVVVNDGGAVSADGLRSTGAAYVNELHGSTPLTVTVTVDTDGGDVTLLQETSESRERSLAPAPIT